MTVFFRNTQTYETLHVIGVDYVWYAVCHDPDKISVIEPIDFAEHMWQCIHAGLTCFEHEAELQFCLPVKSWEILAVTHDDTRFGLTKRYVVMSEDGIQMSDDLKGSRGNC